MNVRLQETAPGVYRIDHDPDRHDDRVISLALVVHRLVERSVGGRGRFAGLAMARTVLVPPPARDGFAVRGSWP